LLTRIAIEPAGETESNTMDLTEITSYIHDHIPITSHLGAEVESFDGEKVSLSAPLKPNLNHRNTAFGGSLSALGILSGWTLLFLKLKEKEIKNRLVIQKSSFDFFDPVDDDFIATCTLPDPETWEKFLRTLTKRGRARITVNSRIESPSGFAGNHEGVYVAIVLKGNESV
jgi:thioesterase domain-containing protein